MRISNRRLFRQILLPVVGVMLAVMCFTALALYWAANRSDRVSVERQIRTAQHSLDASIDDLAYEQQSAALWDALVLELRKSSPDMDWMDANIGGWMYRMFGHDHSWTLDANDEPAYGAVEGIRAPLDQFAPLRPFVQELIDAVRGRTKILGRHDHQAGWPLPPGSTVRTDARAVHATKFLRIFGRPAAASVMQIAPLTDQLAPVVGKEALFVSVRFLDGDFVKQLANRDLLEGLRFSNTPNAASGEEVLPLRGEDGSPIGYFIWRPELPGSEILGILGPTALLALAALVGLMTVLVRSLWRSTIDLGRAIEDLQTAMAGLQTSEAHAQHLSMHDALTELPNRTLFNDRLDQALARVGRGENIAVLAIDLDRFKHVNDTLGHGAGDSLLRDFAARLSASVRAADTVARVGGDEFLILLSDIGAKSDVEALCARILAAAEEPFKVQGTTAHVGVSIGVALAPDAGTDRDGLLRKADIALYSAKQEGRSRHVYFTSAMDSTVKLRSELEAELRVALASGDQIKAYYQPQVDISGMVIGLEALARWEHPARGLVYPDQFIPIAEESGLISALTDQLLRKACEVSRCWPGLFVAVNLSPVQFRSVDFADHIISVAQASGANIKMLQLEITESLLLEDDAMHRESLRHLRAAGFTIALDDFGIGYSSLNYLRHFEFDKIKIDRSFIQNLDTSTDGAAIIKSIVSLGKAMRLTVAAEGVETVDQMHFLSTIGCNELQGYLFSRPIPGNQIDEWLSSHPQLHPPATHEARAA